MLSFIASGDTGEWKLVIGDVRDFWEEKRSSSRRNLCQKWIGLSTHLKRHWGELSLTKQRKLSLKLRSTSTQYQNMWIAFSNVYKSV